MYTVGMGIAISTDAIKEGDLTGFLRTKYDCVLVNTFNQAKSRMADLLAEAPLIIPDHYTAEQIQEMMIAVLALAFTQEDETGEYVYSPDGRGTIFIIKKGELFAPDDWDEGTLEVNVIADHTKCDHETCRA